MEKYIVILEDKPTSDYWLIIDFYYDSCPPRQVQYTQTNIIAKRQSLSECGIVTAKNPTTGITIQAKSIRIN